MRGFLFLCLTLLLPLGQRLNAQAYYPPVQPPEPIFAPPPMVSDAELDLLADEIAFTLEQQTPSDENPIRLVSTSSTAESNRFLDRSYTRQTSTWSDLLVGRTVLQLGYSYTRDELDDFLIETHTYPDMLLRYSVNDWLELRVGWAGWLDTTMTDELFDVSDQFTDTADPSVGAKFRITNQQGWRPGVQLIASLPLETDGNPFVLNSFQPTLSGIYGWNLTERLAFAGSSGLIRVDDENEEDFRFQQGLTLDFLVTKRFGGYLESAMLTTDDDPEFTLTGGNYWYLSDRIQMEYFVGFGLNEVAPDLQAGIGLTIAP